MTDTPSLVDECLVVAGFAHSFGIVRLPVSAAAAYDLHRVHAEPMVAAGTEATTMDGSQLIAVRAFFPFHNEHLR